jgi:hypothetical protein
MFTDAVAPGGPQLKTRLNQNLTGRKPSATWAALKVLWILCPLYTGLNAMAGVLRIQRVAAKFSFTRFINKV